jgi:hypothetical protein
MGVSFGLCFTLESRPRMQYVLKLTAVLLTLLTLVGCASSSGVVKNASPLETGKAVSLDFILVETTSSMDGLKAEQHRINDAIISGLNETGLFKDVSGDETDTNSAPGIKVQANIVEIRKVSDDARSWVGAWAGRARVLVHVTVSDLPSGAPIETFEAEGVSGGSAKSGTTDEAIQQAAGQIVTEIVKINSETGQ